MDSTHENSMPAKQVKTLARNPNERKHRHHRSKKGQSPNSGKWGFDGRMSRLDRQKKEENILEREFEREINQLI